MKLQHYDAMLCNEIDSFPFLRNYYSTLSLSFLDYLFELIHRHQRSGVMQMQSSIDDQTCSGVEIDTSTQGPAKRQKTDIESNWKEAEIVKGRRARTFSHWPHPALYCLRMIEAGFFGCNKSDRVICIYCNLICHQWNIDVDDPCEVHQTLSPTCPFVKSMTCCHSLQYKKINATLPSHRDYVDAQNRSESFSSWSSPRFPSIDKLVKAGFFYDGSKIVCFYCNGTFTSWESDNPPIAEHVRHYPNCNYARQLCGQVLYHQIQQALQRQRGSPLINAGIGNSKNIRQPLSAVDSTTLYKRVKDCMDLWMSQSLLNRGEFERSSIEQCWMDQLQFNDDHFAHPVDLHIACLVLQKQRKILGNDESSIIVPKIALSTVYEQRQQSLPNSANRSYSDIVASFDTDHQAHTEAQQRSNADFKEAEAVTIEREKSMFNRTDIKPSPRAMVEGGWIIHGSENDTSQCPHCYMQYSQWKSDDNPLSIHRHFSPLCPFVLSLNPSHQSPAVMTNTRERYSDEVIAAAESGQYNGVVRVNHGPNSTVSDRQLSFNLLPNNSQINTVELANNGFFFDRRHRSIKCFYCQRTIFIGSHTLPINHHFSQFHSPGQCRYIQQLNDRDPVASVPKAASSGKCLWCFNEDIRVVAASCRHRCLCESCAKVKRLCPRCNRHATEYVIVYSS